jgi:hypothetical protein
MASGSDAAGIDISGSSCFGVEGRAFSWFSTIMLKAQIDTRRSAMNRRLRINPGLYSYLTDLGSFS